jgi:hypothetical protein
LLLLLLLLLLPAGTWQAAGIIPPGWALRLLSVSAA